MVSLARLLFFFRLGFGASHAQKKDLAQQGTPQAQDSRSRESEGKQRKEQKERTTGKQGSYKNASSFTSCVGGPNDPVRDPATCYP